MDLWQIVLADHANIEELCREILHATGSGPNSRAELFEDLETELERHIRAKERVVYPALGRDARTRNYLPELRQEQDEIRHRLRELSVDRNKNSHAWAVDFKELASTITHSFNLEQNGALIVARGTIERQEADRLRRAFEREKLAALRPRGRYSPHSRAQAGYELSTGDVLSALAGAAAAGAAVVAWRMLRQRKHRPSPPAHQRPRPPLPLRRTERMDARRIISTHPQVKGNTNDALIRCIEECYACAQACTSCADACLGEPMIQQLLQCIRLNQDCADVCAATGSVATRRTGSNEEVIRRMLEACATACRICGEECERHASMHEHCRICAESCRRCEQACREALRSMA